MDKNSPIEIVLLTGFLGSGKTTLLKRFLSREDDLSGVVVIVNEFGEVGLDGRLLAGSGTDVIEMTSGCICCSLKADLYLTLKDIARLNPHRVLIEATGVASPAQAAGVLDEPPLSDQYRLARIVTVFDTSMWEIRSVMGSLFWDQLHQADVILANKTDTLEPEVAEEWIDEMRRALPGQTIIPTVQCEIDLDQLLDQRPRVTGLPGALHHGHDHEHNDEHFQSVAFTTPARLDQERLDRFLAEAPPSLYRIKGVVRLPGKALFLNYANGRADWQAWTDDNGTELVLIGLDLDEEAILTALKGCALN